MPAIPEFSDNSTTLPSETFLFKERDVGRGVVNNYSLFPPPTNTFYLCSTKCLGKSLGTGKGHSFIFPICRALGPHQPAQGIQISIHTIRRFASACSVPRARLWKHRHQFQGEKALKKIARKSKDILKRAQYFYSLLQQ